MVGDVSDPSVAWPFGTGRMAEAVRAHDWAATPLGPAGRWPGALRNAVTLVLDHPLPMVLAWGPDLVMIYNDAFRPLLGDRPEALGRPFLEVWAEVRERIEPQIAEALSGHALHFEEAAFTLMRENGPEEAFFDYSYAPVRDESGAVAGILHTAVEVTGRIVASRERDEVVAASLDVAERQAFLLRLGDALRALSDPQAVEAEACRLLGAHLAVERTYYSEIDEAAGEFVVRRDDVRGGAASVAGAHRIADFAWAVTLLRRGEGFVIDDLRRSPLVPESYRAAALDLRLVGCMCVPLVKSGRLVGSLCVTSPAPRAWDDSEIHLLREVSERIWEAIERARAEEALRKSEERFRSFAENSTDALWIADAGAQRLAYLSPAFERIWGERREAALADPSRWVDMLHADDRDEALAALPRAVAGESQQVVYRILRADDGRVRWVQDTVFPIRDAAGTITHVGGIAQDVTEHRETAERLRENQRRLWAVIEGIPQLVWRAGEGGTWTWTSPQWSHYTGQAPEESRGLGWLEALHPDDRDRALAGWREADGASPLEMETRLFHAGEGRHRWFQTRALPVRDEEGRVLEWLGTSTDIDDLRQLQERQGVLVAELQHRTRNLLGVVRSMAERIAASAGSIEEFLPPFRERLGALSRINSLLSRLEHGQRITFDELIRTELGARGLLEGDIAGRVLLEGPPHIRLRSAAVQTFALAIHELTTNAVKYGALANATGRLRVVWRLSRGEGRRDRLQVEWTESGVADMPTADEAPRGGGYGRMLIERALPYQLNATTTYTLGHDGVVCTIDLPLK